MLEKIIIVSPYNSSFTYPINKAFKQLKFQTNLFDYKNIIGNLKFNFFSNLPEFIKSFDQTLFKSKRLILLNKMLINKCRIFKPKYLFVIKGETIDTETISIINKLGVITILWQVDPSFDPIIWSYVNKAGRQYKYYISCEPGKIITKLKKNGFKNVLYMLGAADGLNMNYLYKKVPKIYDIVLVGTYHQEREKYLEALKGLDVHIWGWGNWKHSKISEMFEGRALSQKEMLKVYSQAKIIINIGRAIGSTIPTNLRSFETAQIGGFILTSHQNNIKQIFNIGKEIDTFKTPVELRNKILFYLDHKEKRDLITLEMFNKIKNNHTYTIRLKNLLKNIK